MQCWAGAWGRGLASHGKSMCKGPEAGAGGRSRECGGEVSSGWRGTARSWLWEF